MPYWLFTSTTYGTWLPGDPRGSVTSVRDRRPGDPSSATRREHDVYGDAFEPGNRGLLRSAQRLQAGPTVYLTEPQASIALQQMLATAEVRGWRMLAVSIMANHFHLVIGVRDRTDPRKILTDLKAYATRGLNSGFERPQSGKWWTRNGSRRRLPDQRAVDAAINYVLHKQPNPLVVWPNSESNKAQ